MAFQSDVLHHRRPLNKGHEAQPPAAARTRPDIQRPLPDCLQVLARQPDVQPRHRRTSRRGTMGSTA